MQEFLNAHATIHLERLVSSLTGSRVKSQVSGKNERRETFGASILSFAAPVAVASSITASIEDGTEDSKHLLLN